MLKDFNKLSSEDTKKFEDFINSPYFNVYDTVKKFFHYLKSGQPNITSSYLSDKNISEKIFGESKINILKIRKLKSNFNFLFEKFIMLEEMKKDKAGNDMIMLNALRKKHFLSSYQRKLAQIGKMPKEYFGDEESFFLNMMNYYNELFMDSFTNDKKMAADYSVKKLNYLTYYFIYQSLVYNINYYSDDKIPKESVAKPVSMIEEVYRFIEKNKSHFSADFPDIMTMYYGSLMLHKDDLKYYNLLKAYYEKNKEKFHYGRATIYYMMSEAYFKLKSGKNYDKNILLKLFDLRDEIIKEKNYEKFFGDGRWISPELFFRVFMDAVNVNKLEWSEEYLKKFGQYLPNENRFETIKITRLILDFLRGDFTGISSALNGIKKSNFKYYMHSRFIKMMLLYEKGEIAALEYETESVRKYIQRKKTEKGYSEYMIAKSLKFIYSISMLSGATAGRVKRSGNKYRKFREWLLSGKDIPEYSFWFLGKVKKIEGNS